MRNAEGSESEREKKRKRDHALRDEALARMRAEYEESLRNPPSNRTPTPTKEQADAVIARWREEMARGQDAGGMAPLARGGRVREPEGNSPVPHDVPRPRRNAKEILADLDAKVRAGKAGEGDGTGAANDLKWGSGELLRDPKVIAASDRLKKKRIEAREIAKFKAQDRAEQEVSGTTEEERWQASLPPDQRTRKYSDEELAQKHAEIDQLFPRERTDEERWQESLPPEQRTRKYSEEELAQKHAEVDKLFPSTPLSQPDAAHEHAEEGDYTKRLGDALKNADDARERNASEEGIMQGHRADLRRYLDELKARHAALTDRAERVVVNPSLADEEERPPAPGAGRVVDETRMADEIDKMLREKPWKGAVKERARGILSRKKRKERQEDARILGSREETWKGALKGTVQDLKKIGKDIRDERQAAREATGKSVWELQKQDILNWRDKVSDTAFDTYYGAKKWLFGTAFPSRPPETPEIEDWLLEQKSPEAVMQRTRDLEKAVQDIVRENRGELRGNAGVRILERAKKNSQEALAWLEKTPPEKRLKAYMLLVAGTGTVSAIGGAMFGVETRIPGYDGVAAGLWRASAPTLAGFAAMGALEYDLMKRNFKESSAARMVPGVLFLATWAAAFYTGLGMERIIKFIK